MKRLTLLTLCALALFGTIAGQAVAGTIEGTVRPLVWAQEVEVCVAEAVPGERCVVPEANGSYVFQGLEGQMKLEFVPTYRSRMSTQFYDHKSTFAEATFIKVPHEGALKGINADLVEGGAITGTVTAEVGGELLSEVEVCAVSGASPPVKSCDETDSSGEYEVHSLADGSYKVGFWGRGKSAEYKPWYYQGASSFGQATPIHVAAAETVSGVEATLAKGAQIGGAVTAAADGAPIEGIRVCLFTVAESAAQRCTESGEGGAYSFQGLLDGSYQVGFSLGSAEIGGTGTTAEVGGFRPQFYDAVATRAQAATISLLAPGIVEGVDAALLGVSPPVPPAPPLVVSSPIVAAPTVIAEPKPKQAGCRKPKRKKKIKGKVRCVKPAKHKKKHSKHKSNSAPNGHGEKKR